VLARFCAANNQFAAQEFFVVQFLYRAFRFVDGLHLDKCETFRSLIVTVTDYFCVLNVTDPVKQVEQVTLRCVDREIADVQPGRRNFDRLRLTLGPRLGRMLLRAVATCRG
jgi:hypothetical protein